MNKQYLILHFICFLLVLPPSVLQGQKKLTLEDFHLDHTFLPEFVFDVYFMNDNQHFTMLEYGREIVQYNFVSDKPVKKIIPYGTLLRNGITYIEEYAFSANEEMLLLATNKQGIYRRSFSADYYVLDIENDELIKLADMPGQQAATFSPDGNHVAFVSGNNLYIKSLIDGDLTQITFDGEKNKIINGIPDWAYEEEFGYNRAYEWSLDGQYLAYCRFDENRVKQFSMFEYKGMVPELLNNKLYPAIKSWKYPKAGEENAVVSVYVYDTLTGNKTQVDIGEETDQYIPRIKWAQNSGLCVFRLNRLQNRLDLLLANPVTGKSKLIYTEENDYFIDYDFFDDLTFVNHNEFLWISEKSGFSHIYLYDINSKTMVPVTNGEWDVTKFIGFDEKSEVVYYQSAEISPMKRDVYSISLDGNLKRRHSDRSGTNDAIFSRDFQHYINFYSDMNTPYQVQIFDISGSHKHTLVNNLILNDILKSYKIPEKSFFSFNTSNGTELNGYMIKPPDFSTRRKYPVVMTQYSGPNSQRVLDDWNFNWEYFLAQEGFIVVCVDGRGTGARGEAFRKLTYLQLGHYETIDQVETAKYIGSLSFVDPARIGIYGSSYGGYMVLLAMSKGGGIFKAGVSQAPVTNWRFYDTIYTERFMRKPQDNPEGYDDNSPITHADGLEGKLLLIHGTADDNVHMQNTLEYAEALVQANKQFDMHIYTNRDHSLQGGNTRLHLFTRIFEFFRVNL